MCVMLIQKIDSPKINKGDFDSYANENPDGFGLSYVDDKDKLIINKTMSAQEFWEMYNFVYNGWNKTSPILTHFRLGTSGGKKVEMCHPFRVNDDICVAHNGVINIGHNRETVSDTYQFTESILKDCAATLFNNETTKKLIESNIGSYNKLIMLNSKKEINIYNEDEGTWINDNSTWISRKMYNTYYNRYNHSNVTKTNNRSNIQCKCHGCDEYFDLSETYKVISPIPKEGMVQYCITCMNYIKYIIRAEN